MEVAAESPAELEARPKPEPEPERYSVSELTGIIAGSLDGLGTLSVEGELSGFKPAASGHLYFDLKDEHARLSCVVWRSQVKRALAFEPEDGAKVLVRGRLDVYAPRGNYKLIASRIEPLGMGELLVRFERIKAELAALGRFDRSRALPAFPRLVGVVTSRDGAALRDFLRTRSKRWPAYPVRLCHAPVQGPGAAEGLAQALRRLAASGVDVVVLCRGGGSLEDLWAFNERALADAIWDSPVPVVSGVGHESDTTLSDLCADHRAHTPTDAAQCVIPDRHLLEERLERAQAYLLEAVERRLEHAELRLRNLGRSRTLRDPAWILGDRALRLEGLKGRLRAVTRERLAAAEGGLRSLSLRLERKSPHAQLGRWQERLEALGRGLSRAGSSPLVRAEARLAPLARALESVSPLKVLARGYSTTRREDSEVPLVSVEGVEPGDALRTRLHRGSVLSRVERVLPPEDEESP